MLSEKEIPENIIALCNAEKKTPHTDLSAQTSTHSRYLSMVILQT